MVDLGNLGGSYASAADINDSGHIVGLSTTNDNKYHAFLYSDGVMTDLGVPIDCTGSAANGINDFGQIVGSMTLNAGQQHAFVYNSGTMTDLNTLIDPACNVTLESAHNINESGQIICYGINGGGQLHGVLLTPIAIPEPAGLVLLGMGVVSLLGYVWRRRGTRLGGP